MYQGVRTLEMSLNPAKPPRHASPLRIAISGIEWEKKPTSNRRWSCYTAAGQDFHVTIKNNTGHAHASPEGAGAGDLVGKSLHVYALGPVTNFVPTHLQDQVNAWLEENETRMRATCAAFTTEWPKAMDEMRQQYEAELNEYHNRLRKEVEARPWTKIQENAQAAHRRALGAVLQKAKDAAQELVSETPGIWTVKVFKDIYALPEVDFSLAESRSGWTETALEKAENLEQYGQKFFMAWRNGMLYIFESRHLKSKFKLNRRKMQIMSLPPGEISSGLLRCPGGIYRIKPGQVEKILNQSDLIDLNAAKDCVRIEMGDEVVVVWPKNPKVRLQDLAMWNSWVGSLPEGILEQSFIKLQDGTEYLWLGTWPPEPKRDQVGGFHKVVAHDNVYIVDLADSRYFTKIHASSRHQAWVKSLPEIESVRLLKHGTLTFNVRGTTYLVTRGRYDRFLEECFESKVTTGTPGCFSLTPENFPDVLTSRGIKRFAIDPKAHSDLLRTTEQWQREIEDIPKVKIQDGKFVIAKNDIQIVFEVKSIPEYDQNPSDPGCCALPRGQGDQAETLLINPYRQANHFQVRPIFTTERTLWLKGLPVGSFNEASVAAVMIGDRLCTFRMANETWIHLTRDSYSIPTGTPDCFLLKANDGGFMGPIRLSDSRLVDYKAWEGWTAGMVYADRLHNNLYALGYGAETQVFSIDYRHYTEPPVGTEGCFLIENSRGNPDPFLEADHYFELDDPELLAKIGREAHDALSERAGVSDFWADLDRTRGVTLTEAPLYADYYPDPEDLDDQASASAAFDAYLSWLAALVLRNNPLNQPLRSNDPWQSESAAIVL